MTRTIQVALRPDSDNSPDDEQPARPSTEQEMLMREVDEAVRQDQMGSALKKFGLPMGLLLVVGLAGFGGWLYWKDQQEAQLEQGSEELIKALDEIDAGQDDSADAKLAALAVDGSPGAAASARLARAGLAFKAGRTADGIALYEQVAADAKAPKPFRDLATIRAVAAQFDMMKPQEVIDRLKPLAVPGNPWFGSAGEMVAMAYLAQDKRDLAGPLFAEIAKDKDVPESLRARTRQMAGLLGFDAVTDVDTALSEVEAEAGGGGAAAQPAE